MELQHFGLELMREAVLLHLAPSIRAKLCFLPPRPEQPPADPGCPGIQLPPGAGGPAARRRRLLWISRWAAGQAAKDGGWRRVWICSAPSYVCPSTCYCCYDVTNPWAPSMKPGVSHQVSKGHPLSSPECFAFRHKYDCIVEGNEFGQNDIKCRFLYILEASESGFSLFHLTLIKGNWR